MHRRGEIVESVGGKGRYDLKRIGFGIGAGKRCRHIIRAVGIVGRLEPYTHTIRIGGRYGGVVPPDFDTVRSRRSRLQPDRIIGRRLIGNIPVGVSAAVDTVQSSLSGGTAGSVAVGDGGIVGLQRAGDAYTPRRRIEIEQIAALSGERCVT